MLYFWIICVVLELLFIAGLYTPLTKNKFRSFLANYSVKFGLITLFRLGIAGMFLMACYPKISSPYGFAQLVAQYQMLPSFSVNFFSLWLPVMELLIAIGLIFTPYVKEFSLLTFALFIMFLIALGQALIRDLGITCGCFDIEGAQDKTGAWISFLRDIVIAPICFWVLRHSQKGFIWQFSRQNS